MSIHPPTHSFRSPAAVFRLLGVEKLGEKKRKIKEAVFTLSGIRRPRHIFSMNTKPSKATTRLLGMESLKNYFVQLEQNLRQKLSRSHRSGLAPGEKMMGGDGEGASHTEQ